MARGAGDPKRLNTVMRTPVTQPNVYDCRDCLSAKRKHKVIQVPRGETNRYSTWGAGVPCHVMVCTGCGAENGPWVSCADVGDGW